MVKVITHGASSQGTDPRRLTHVEPVSRELPQRFRGGYATCSSQAAPLTRIPER